jgi:hypothetical protein
MMRGTRKVRLPNPHKRGDIHISLLSKILKQAGIEDDEWNGVARGGHRRAQEADTTQDPPLAAGDSLTVPERLARLEQIGREAQEEAKRKILAFEAARDEAIAEVRERGSITIVAGEWYLAVYCDNCLRPIPLFRDPLKGESRAAGSGVLRVTCRRQGCGHESEYQTARLVSLRAVEAGSLPG